MRRRSKEQRLLRQLEKQRAHARRLLLRAKSLGDERMIGLLLPVVDHLAVAIERLQSGDVAGAADASGKAAAVELPPHLRARLARIEGR